MQNKAANLKCKCELAVLLHHYILFEFTCIYYRMLCWWYKFHLVACVYTCILVYLPLVYTPILINGKKFYFKNKL